MPGLGSRALFAMSWGNAVSRERGPGEVDLAEFDESDLMESGDVAGAMSVAVRRLRHMAAAAFDAGRIGPTHGDTVSVGRGG